jgi:hypothetical protein
MLCSFPVLLWWLLRRISVVWFEVKLSLVLCRNICGGAGNNAMNLGACANSSVRVGYRLLVAILRENGVCIYASGISLVSSTSFICG